LTETTTGPAVVTPGPEAFRFENETLHRKNIMGRRQKARKTHKARTRRGSPAMKNPRTKVNPKDRGLIKQYIQVARENGCRCAGLKPHLLSEWTQADAPRREWLRRYLKSRIAEHTPGFPLANACPRCINLDELEPGTIIMFIDRLEVR